MTIVPATYYNASEQKIWSLLETVCDPEVPVLTVLDLGIVRAVSVDESSTPVAVTITITPTYSGCPAMDVIAMSIRMVLLPEGFPNIDIKQVLSPAWTTDWMSEAGRQKLMAYGIAPPNPRQSVCTPDRFQEEEAIQCPQCHSWHTTMVSQFGSTACKALYKCEDCKEPFDYFKCH
ncbi:MAG: phenylacetate-CoA oxygenase subunit PaaJ [Chitinophagaceae bacterium]|nr:phenylacetate-CoA oxygenase subunit PaaJ [Chitinophagaceae bacterium]